MGKISRYIIFVFTLLCSPAWGAEYYVCSSGCDETTIQAIFDNNDLAPNDIVEIRADTPGGSKTYGEKITPGANDDGSIVGYLTVMGRDGDTITVDGTDLAFAGASSYLKLQNLTITSTSSHGIYFSGGDHYSFEDITMTANIGGSGFAFANLTAGTVIFTDCTVNNTGAEGVYMATGTGDQTVVATRLTTNDNTANGFRAFVGLADLTLTDCTATGNGQRGAYINDVDGDIVISGGDYSGNTQSVTTISGMIIEANNIAYDSILISNTIFNSNAYHGLEIGYCDVGSCGSINLQNITANDNYCTGVLIEDADNGLNTVNISYSTFDGNNNGCYDLPTRGAGVWVEDSPNVIIENSTFKNTEVVSETSGRGVIFSTDGTISDLVLKSNIFEDNYIHLDVQATAGVNINSSSIVHNTFKGAEYGSIKVWAAGAETIDVLLKNNISLNPGVQHVEQLSTAGTEDYDYNSYYPEGNDFWTWGATTNIDTLSGWQTASSQDANSLNIDPQMDANYLPHARLIITGGTIVSGITNRTYLGMVPPRPFPPGSCCIY